LCQPKGSAIEAGEYWPSLEVAFRVAEVFGLRVDAVFNCARLRC
jgi:DNA-binding XRE family transcriptional regulator